MNYLVLPPQLGLTGVLPVAAATTPPLAATLADLACAAARTILAAAALSSENPRCEPPDFSPGVRPLAPPFSVMESQDSLGNWTVVYSAVSWSTRAGTESDPPTCP